jgi:hypothetical protein
MRLLSVDPGDHVGVALWNDGELDENYTVSRDDFMISLVDGEFEGVTHVVAEDFRLFRNKASRQVGSKMPASLVLGALELWCRQHGIWMNKQAPNILTITAMHANVEMPAGHLPDSLSAYLHGYHFLEGKGILHPIDR